MKTGSKGQALKRSLVGLLLSGAVGVGGVWAQAPGAGTKPAAAAAGTTRPASAGEEEAKGRAVFNTLLQQGTNALAAGEFAAALEALQDAKQVFERKLRGRAVAVGSPEHVALLHGLALTYQLVKKPEKASPLFEANSPLDRACGTKGASRQLLLTRGVLDSTQGYLAMRTAVSLTNYLKEHPDDLDSEILDLLFTALSKAEERVTNRQLMFEPMVKLYDDFNKRLESTRPGEKRWGVQWVSEQTFRVEMAKRQAAIKKWNEALARADSAAAGVRSAQESVDRAKRGAATGNRGALNAALDRLARARAVKADLDAKAEEVRLAIPPVPTLTGDDFARLLTPKDVDVVVSGKAKGGTAVASAAGGADGSRSVKFSLGGTTAKPTATAAPPAGGGGVATAPVSVFEPTPAARRTFARSATGFAVGPDLLLTAAPAVKGAKRVMVEFTDGQAVEATVERAGDDGLALLRVKGMQMAYVNLASEFAGGPVRCPAFPEVSVFGVAVEVIQGRALAPKDEGWQVALGRHPRLPGAPLLDAAGNLVGVEMGDRDDVIEKLPALSFGRVKAFLGADAPGRACANPQVAPVVQITATFER